MRPSQLGSTSVLALLLPVFSALGARGQQAPIALGPFGGSASCVLAHATQADELLAVRAGSGLVRSTDGGLNFSPYGSGLPGAPAELVANPLAANVIYAPVGNQVQRSLDFGASWAPWSPVAGAAVKSLELSPDGQLVLVWTGSQIHRSANGGGQWGTVFTGTLIGNAAIAPSDATRCYASTFNGVARSTNAGLSFAVPPTGLTQWTKWVLPDPSNAERVYAGTTSGLWLSTDGALHFTKLASAPNLSVQFLAWEGPAVGGTLWAGALSGMWFSPDQGASWTAFNAGLQPGSTIPLDFDSSASGTRYLAADGGFFRAAPAASAWTQTGFAEVGIYAAAIAGAGGARLVGAEKGVYAAPAGQPLVPSGYFFDFGAHTDALLVDPADAGRWLSAGVGAFIDNAVVRVLTLGGAQVSIAYEHFGGGTVWTLARDPFDSAHLIGGVYPAGFGSAGLIASSDNGASFQDVPGTAGWSCRAVAFDPLLAGHVIALFGNGQWADSFNSGASWTLHAAWPGTAQAVTLAFDPWQAGVYFRADLGTGWLRSDNAGGNWAPLGAGAGLRSQIVLSDVAPGLVLASDAAGAVLRSGDGGASFETLFTAPSGGPCAALALDAASGALVVGTAAGSAFELPGASPYVRLGSGTAGSAGFVPRHFGKGGLPAIGNAGFQFAADRLLGGSSAWLFVGGSDLGLPLFGGSVHTGPPQLVFVGQATGGTPGLGGSGALSFALPIPSDGALVGASVFSQVFAFDPAASDSIALSAGLRTTVQP